MTKISVDDSSPSKRHNNFSRRGTPLLISRRALLKDSTSAGALIAMGGVTLLASLPSPAQAAVVSVELDVTLAMINGVECRTYNGVVPGPTISAAPGDRIDVRLLNNLPVNPDDNDCLAGHESNNHGTHVSATVPASHNEEHGLNTTNLHTHGLHVSPHKDSTGQFDADNVFLKILPKDQVASCWEDETFRRHEANYRFELSQDHPPGTNWYHAHKHGSTAKQVSEGMVGPLIVRDPQGLMPSYIEKAPERTFVFTGKGPWLAESNGSGVFKPTVTLRPGAVERWRIINANPSGTAFVSLVMESGDVELWQIAYDGLTLPRRLLITPSNKEPWENYANLAPGNRTDLMIRIKRSAQDASIALRAIPGSFEFLHSEADHSLVALAATEVKIGIKVDGDPVDDEWSEDDALPGPGVEPIEFIEPIRQRTVVFKEVLIDGDMKNTIDGKLYDGVVGQRMNLGTVEQWTIVNETKRTHPFHIHVNPFFVTHVNGAELQPSDPLRRWQDTIALPPMKDGVSGSVTFLSRFADFRGAFVIHCHILQHEDDGMMQKVEVV
ncbi:multicopper oxidase family protein [Rhizobium leguminosarum]|uniref:multicopper oxidase family protein n=1 Tax=Rhizobium leguminosarum TaxID=384 RepID=UPI001C917616|nr:multicopper oxidase family protein [Rhizobium leguminosarum]MBY2988290.1 multicopper oxidase family protein [Rhizobium leguminosarum]